jgi:Cu/Ag efflux protein CusF
MKPETSRKTGSTLFLVVVVGFLVALGLEEVLAPAALGAEPVSAKITAIDAKAGFVTAKETATGRAFQFQVKDAALLKSLKVGHEISADLTAMTVTLPAAKPGVKPVDLPILKAEPVGKPQARDQGAEGFTQLGPDRIKIKEGYVFKRTSPSGGSVAQAMASGGGVEVSCRCMGGAAGGCGMQIEGPFLTCYRKACNGDCNVKVDIPMKVSPRQ